MYKHVLGQGQFAVQTRIAYSYEAYIEFVRCEHRDLKGGLRAE
jgi:hypothetical protein